MEKTKVNATIRKKIEKSGLRQYQVAYAIGVSKWTLNSWLSIPLTAERKERILKAIDKLKTE
ncbi:hypothetical protein SAMN04487770_1632 [Butyrivibrio sp. ob235]|uniref:helix-turn-helix transcriptional regulator n=1 Tax=Butyrivibrio sp. ob235 TaxID=1761780 RepID=UPI0008AD11EB|nr:helix-turn-helix transcriptional regulator [Butyrivibrio sp. ob235]SEM67412.1 hypothetical protein SAMN04487770_1632 [Butyrivibrio sp. ob235]